MKTRIVISLLILAMLAFPGCAIVLPQAAAASLSPQIKTFSVNPGSIEAGKPVTLAWEVPNAASVIIEPGLSNLPAAGSAQLNPSRTTDYTLIATNKYGTSRSTLHLSVTEPETPALSEPPRIISFRAAPQHVWAGGTVILSWEVLNATSISLKSGSGDVYRVKDAFGSMGLEPFMPTEYTLTAANAAGSVELKTMVTIRKDEAYESHGSGGGSTDCGCGG